MIAMKDDVGFTLEEWFEEVRGLFVSLADNLNRTPDFTPAFVRNEVAKIYGSSLGDNPAVHLMCKLMFVGVNMVESTRLPFPATIKIRIERHENPFIGMKPVFISKNNHNKDGKYKEA